MLAPSPWAGTNVHGRKLGASHSGAELGAVDAGVELGAVDAGAEHVVSGAVNDARCQVDSNSRRPGENLGQTTRPDARGHLHLWPALAAVYAKQTTTGLLRQATAVEDAPSTQLRAEPC